MFDVIVMEKVPPLCAAVIEVELMLKFTEKPD